jgi:hypothetical protein
VAQRIVAIGKLLGDMPKPLDFGPDGFVRLDGQGWRAEGNGGAADEVPCEGKSCFHIRSESDSARSWRKTLALEPGKYRFEARLCTKGVEPSQSERGEGAGLRISGRARLGLNSASGDTPWEVRAFEFNAPGGDVVLVAELCAKSGDAWFDKESLKLVRLKE